MLVSLLANLMLLGGGEPIPTNVPSDDIVDFGAPQGGIKKEDVGKKILLDQDEEAILLIISEWVISNNEN